MPSMVNDGLAERVADNVRRYRHIRGISMSELARRAGVSTRTMGNLESGSNATLATLVAVADALELPVTELMFDDDGTKLTVARGGDTEPVDVGAQLVRHLASIPSCDHLVLSHVTYRDGEQHLSDAHGDGVVERLYVVKGRLRFGPRDEPAVLRKGDFATLRADVPHVYEAIGGDVEAILATSHDT